MKLHSNVITEQDVKDALQTEIETGRIAPYVRFKVLAPKGSRTHRAAFEIQLESIDCISRDGRRRGNDGAYGGMQELWAATYDEWGWLIAALYRLDDDAIWGTVKNPVYAYADDFHDKTAETYTLGALLAKLSEGPDNDPFPYVWSNPKIGRYGAGRSMENRYNAYQYRPRTAEWYAKFAHLATLPV